MDEIIQVMQVYNLCSKKLEPGQFEKMLNSASDNGSSKDLLELIKQLDIYYQLDKVEYAIKVVNKYSRFITEIHATFLSRILPLKRNGMLASMISFGHLIPAKIFSNIFAKDLENETEEYLSIPIPSYEHLMEICTAIGNVYKYNRKLGICLIGDFMTYATCQPYTLTALANKILKQSRVSKDVIIKNIIARNGIGYACNGLLHCLDIFLQKNYMATINRLLTANLGRYPHTLIHMFSSRIYAITVNVEPREYYLKKSMKKHKNKKLVRYLKLFLWLDKKGVINERNSI